MLDTTPASIFESWLCNRCNLLDFGCSHFTSLALVFNALLDEGPVLRKHLYKPQVDTFKLSADPALIVK